MRKTLDYALTRLLVFLMSAMVLNVVWQVFTRFVMQDASSWTEELARFLLIWLGLLGAAWAVGQQMHLAIDLLPTSLSGKKARRLNQLLQVFVLIFALLAMVIGGGRLVYLTLTLEQTSAALGLPLGYVYLALPLSGLLIVAYGLLNIVDEGKRGKYGE
jgi:TRAP-type C4-dicarboxylate transport system permease small subunit